MALFTRDDFASYLHEEVDNSSTDVALRVAGGWLMSATGLTAWPSPVPDDLFGWALELAAIAYRNPEGMSSERVDDYQASYDATRRAQILEAARRGYSAAAGPVFSFPDPDWHWTAVAVVED